MAGDIQRHDRIRNEEKFTLKGGTAGKEYLSGSNDKLKELITEASTEKLDEVLDFIDAFLEEWECPMKVMTQINVAAEEIFVNIAHYSGANEAKISVGKSGDMAEITFTDSGRPYNPLAKPDPDVTLSAEERDIGGLGVYIVKKTMDEVSYDYRGDRNIFTMRKRIAG